jgi:hypothetical protein
MISPSTSSTRDEEGFGIAVNLLVHTDPGESAHDGLHFGLQSTRCGQVK